MDNHDLDLMIGGASVEETLTLWASSLRDVKQRVRRLFTQERVAAAAGQFLDGLLGNEPRKTGWMRAEAAGDPGPWRRQQVILGRGQRDADALRDIVRERALETLGREDAVLVIDETGFLKQGKASCGVARQYTGGQDHQLLDRSVRRLCVAASPCLHRPGALPAKGMDGRTRSPAGSACPERCGLGDEAQDRASNDYARDRRKGAVLVCDGDSVYGTGEIETLLRKAGKAVFWVLLPITCSVLGQAAACRPPRSRRAFPRRPGTACRPAKGPEGRAGTTGPIYLQLADRDASEYNDDLAGEWTRGLLIRRNIADASLAFFSTCAQKACPRRSWRRWKAIPGPSRTASKPPRTSSALITTKPAPGMAGIVMSHSSCLPRHDGRHPLSGQNWAIAPKNATEASFLIRWSIQEIRRIAMKLAQRRIPHAHPRLVVLAPDPSGQRARSSSQTKNVRGRDAHC